MAVSFWSWSCCRYFAFRTRCTFRCTISTVRLGWTFLANSSVSETAGIAQRWEWIYTISNTFTGVTNNYKLIQFQYKLLLRISTYKYMRFKMNIFKDNGRCGLCNGALETLEHIFLYSPNTKIFIRSLNIFIRHKICREYSDIDNYYLVTCYHSNPLINYLNITAKSQCWQARPWTFIFYIIFI